MQNVVADIREELANLGIEFTFTQLDDILQALAFTASQADGYAMLDFGSFWGLEVEADLREAPDGSYYKAGLVLFDTKDWDVSGEMN